MFPFRFGNIIIVIVIVYLLFLRLSYGNFSSFDIHRVSISNPSTGIPGKSHQTRLSFDAHQKTTRRNVNTNTNNRLTFEGLDVKAIPGIYLVVQR